MNSFFSELKRRKVFRVAIVYAATAFVVLQAADIMLPRLGVPEWAMTLIVLLLVLGFPVAVVLGWALELTPDGVKVTAPQPAGNAPAPALLGRRTLFAASLLVVLGVGLGTGWSLKPRTTVPPGSSVAAAVVTAASIAVLPFVNISADADNEYFADGISEELLNVLVRVQGLGVASRTSSFAYKGRELPATEIAGQLGVSHILEGSVRKSGGRVRITAQLIDAVNDRHLWSETYDRELTDIFAIQDEIANAIVLALRTTLGSDRVTAVVTVRADTENFEAYELYLKARELFIARSELVESVRLFEQVVALDPDFARGWEGLAAVSIVIDDWGFRDRDYTATAIEAAERALELDPSLSMPWAVRGMAIHKAATIDWAAGLELYDRAIAADPENGSAYLWRSIAWVNLGFFQRALADSDRCLAIDPAYENCRRWRALTLLFTGDVDGALDLFEQGVANGFTRNRSDSFVEPLLRRGDVLAALLLMQNRPYTGELQQAILHYVLGGTAPRDVRSLVERNVSEDRDKPYVYMLFRAWELAAGHADDASTSFVVFWNPAYSGIRSSPAFKVFLERFGVPSYWREHGYPPQCRPVGARDFRCEA